MSPKSDMFMSGAQVRISQSQIVETLTFPHKTADSLVARITSLAPCHHKLRIPPEITCFEFWILNSHLLTFWLVANHEQAFKPHLRICLHGFTDLGVSIVFLKCTSDWTSLLSFYGPIWSLRWIESFPWKFSLLLSLLIDIIWRVHFLWNGFISFIQGIHMCCCWEQTTLSSVLVCYYSFTTSWLITSWLFL
jgi:hypothetical protein